MESHEIETATLGGGCFWCLEAAYGELKGIEAIVSGYAGGFARDPSYEAVCSGTTGHAEVVQLTFDPTVISFQELLGVFFVIHDPTTVDRQGNDIGSQYRSIILYHCEKQLRVAREVMADLKKQGVWQSEIVTQLEPYSEFYPAEEYHQRFFARNPQHPYCQVVVSPKVAKVRQQFVAKLAGQA